MGVTARPLDPYVPTPWGKVRSNSTMRYVVAVRGAGRPALTHRSNDRGRALRALQTTWGAAVAIDRRTGALLGSKGLSLYAARNASHLDAIVPPNAVVNPDERGRSLLALRLASGAVPPLRGMVVPPL